MKISFRLRIALLSLLLTGSSLVILSGFSWWQIRENKIARLDAQISNALVLLSRSQKAERWHDHVERLTRIIGSDDDQHVFLLALNRENVLYNGTGLTQEQIRSLPWPTPPQLARPTIADERMRRPPPIKFNDVILQRKKWHVGVIATPDIQIAIGVDVALIREDMRPITAAFLVSVPIVLILVAAAAWLLAARALSPVKTLTQKMKTLSERDLHERVDAHNSSKEFYELINVFNALLERLETSFNQAIRFSGDAAHELKTPLAIIQGQLERAIQETPAGSALQHQLSDALTEARRITAICRKLLLLSQADAGQLRLMMENIHLSPLLEELADDIRLLAPTLSLQTTISPNVHVQGDRDLLQQALQNLITNAIKYNIPNGFISISATQKNARVEITVTNSSLGLDEKSAAHLFDRFYRGNSAHHRDIDGVGLGLSITQEIIKAHGGELMLTVNEPHVTGFMVVLH